MREVGLLCVPQVVHERTGGTDGDVVRGQAEALESPGAQLIDQRPPRGVELEVPRLDPRDRHRRAGDGGEVLGQRRIRRGDDLPRPQHRKLVVQGLPPICTHVLRRRELPRRQVEQRHADAFAAGRDRQQERRLAGVEIPRIEQRAGREYTHHLALHDALRLARVFHLLADRDAIALAHEAGQIRLERVIGDAAHRDGAAGRVLGA